MASDSASILYLDNAATSFPKPPQVIQAVLNALQTAANPGRSGHRLSLNAARLIFEARTKAALWLGVDDSRRVVFTKSCTEAINLVLLGTLKRGDHVVTSSMEHNAVARPLRFLEKSGIIELTIVQADSYGFVTAGQLKEVCRRNTALVVLVHGSNVNGAVNDIRRAALELEPIPLLVDAAQTAGHLPIAVDAWNVGYLAFSGHKGFLGPTGVGGLCFGKNATVPEPLVRGGTGSSSEHDVQPTLLPDLMEAGTQNVPGLAGLAAGISALEVRGAANIVQEDRNICRLFIEGLAAIPAIRLIGPPTAEDRLPTFGLLVKNRDPGEVALILERQFGILVRSGLQCAPWAHQTLGTFPHGTVRISFGSSTPLEAVDRVLVALKSLAGDASRD